MDGDRFPAVDPRETYAPLTLDGFRDLIDRPFRSGLWKEHFMVRRFLTLAYQVTYDHREAPRS